MKRIAVAIAVVIAATGAAAEAPKWTLTPSGWGPAKIGMTQAQVSKALRVELEGDFFAGGDSCQELIPTDPALAGLYFMFEDGKLTRITATDQSKVATPRGVHTGSMLEDVKKAYGLGLKTEPHHYEDPPAEYVTYWVKPDQSGVRFEVDTKGKVESIHAGTSSIQYVEGCA